MIFGTVSSKVDDMSVDLALILRHRARCLTSPESERYEASIVAEVIDVLLPLIEYVTRLESRGLATRLCLECPVQLFLGLKRPGIVDALRSEIERRLGTLEARREATPAETILRVIEFDRQSLIRGRDQLESINWDLLTLYSAWLDRGLIEPLVGPFSDVPLTAHQADPGALQAQLNLSIDLFRELFGRAPAGFLLTGHGHTSSMAGLLAVTDVNYAVVDQAAFSEALVPLQDGPYAPVHCPDGALALFADQHNFYRWKVTSDPDEHYRRRNVIGPELWDQAGQGRRALIYHPADAASEARLHGQQVCASRIQEARTVRRRAQAHPIILGCVDVGRRADDWYEVFDFVEGFLEQVADTDVIQASTPGLYLRSNQRNRSCWLGPTTARQRLSSLLLARMPELHEFACRLQRVKRLAEFFDKSQIETLHSATKHLLWAQRFARESDEMSSAGTSLYTRHLHLLNEMLHALETALPEGAEVPTPRPTPKPKPPRRTPVYNPLTIT